MTKDKQRIEELLKAANILRRKNRDVKEELAEAKIENEKMEKAIQRKDKKIRELQRDV